MLISQVRKALEEFNFSVGGYKRVTNVQYLEATRKSDGLEVTVVLIDGGHMAVFGQGAAVQRLKGRLLGSVQHQIEIGTTAE